MPTWYSAVSPGNAGKILTSSTLSGSGLLQSGGEAVFTAWGGGIITEQGVYNGSTFLAEPAMVVFGGGHTDYGGNELYALAKLQSDTPIYLRLRDATSPAPTNVNFDGSGNPVSRHTYQTISWVGGTRNWLFSAGALFRYTDASSHLVGHYANLDTSSPNTNNPWNQVASMPGGGGAGNITCWDSVNDVVWFNGLAANQVGYYDPSVNSWSDAGFKSPSAGTNAHSAIDTTRGLWFAVWAGSTAVQGYNVSAKSVSSDYYTVNTTGTAPPSGDNKSILWDPIDDRFVVWAGGNTLYYLTPPTTNPGQGGNAWTWSSQTYTGSTVPSAQTNSTFGRFAYLSDPRCYVLWYDAVTDPYFFRPDSAVDPTITGTLSVTNANDTVSATGVTTIVGTSSTTNTNDTISASGTITAIGTSNTIAADDAVVASGFVGNSVDGTAAITEQNDTSAGVGVLTIVGTTAVTNTDDTATASGTTTITGTTAQTNNNDTPSAFGYVGDPPTVTTYLPLTGVGK